ncbi:UNVERIFIED_CONTAM: Non-functional NADPH-dependent codeinone reductase 2 [Sesamum calycinum]|uniref:Non-functional NADPH-dependent codeinone reductase 2 n=1 Tax=Sesamum calycinum TaxID=2727403 RepID=A0AAW2KFE6_9LAMI
MNPFAYRVKITCNRFTQVALRWAYEQGIGIVIKSFNKKRMKENIDIFEWSLSNEEVDRISEIPQGRVCLGIDYTSVYGPYRTIEELWMEKFDLNSKISQMLLFLFVPGEVQDFYYCCQCRVHFQTAV